MIHLPIPFFDYLSFFWTVKISELYFFHSSPLIFDIRLFAVSSLYLIMGIVINNELALATLRLGIISLVFGFIPLSYAQTVANTLQLRLTLVL